MVMNIWISNRVRGLNKILESFGDNIRVDFRGGFVAEPLVNEEGYKLIPNKRVKSIEVGEELEAHLVASSPDATHATITYDENKRLVFYMFPEKDHHSPSCLANVGIRLGHVGQKRGKPPLIFTLRKIFSTYAPLVINSEISKVYGSAFLDDITKFGNQVICGTWGGMACFSAERGVTQIQVTPANFFDFIEARTEKPAYVNIGGKNVPTLSVQLGYSFPIAFYGEGTQTPNEPITAYLKLREKSSK